MRATQRQSTAGPGCSYTVKQQTEHLLEVEIHSKSKSAFEHFLAKYGAEFVENCVGNRPVIRIGTLLTKLKSPDQPHIEDVLAQLKSAWKNDHRDIDHLRGAVLEADLVTEDGYRAVVR